MCDCAVPVPSSVGVWVCARARVQSPLCSIVVSVIQPPLCSTNVCHSCVCECSCVSLSLSNLWSANIEGYIMYPSYSSDEAVWCAHGAQLYNPLLC